MDAEEAGCAEASADGELILRQLSYLRPCLIGTYHSLHTSVPGLMFETSQLALSKVGIQFGRPFPECAAEPRLPVAGMGLSSHAALQYG